MGFDLSAEKKNQERNKAGSYSDNKVLLLIVASVIILGCIFFFTSTHKKNNHEPVVAKNIAAESQVENHLRDRYQQYIDACQEYRVKESFSFLTQYSKDTFKLESWGKKIMSDSDLVTETITKVLLLDSGIEAIIGLRMKRRNGSQSNYFQTWVVENDEWYRAYSEDQEGEKDKTSEHKISTADSPEEEVQESLPESIPFVVDDFSYNWKFDRATVLDSKLYLPEIRFYIRNNSEQPIEYLQMKVQFQNTYETSIFAEDDAYVVGSGDLPLAPNSRSSIVIQQGDRGLNIRTQLAIAELDKQYEKQYLAKIKQFTDYIEPQLYYKTEYSSEWKILDSFLYQ